MSARSLLLAPALVLFAIAPASVQALEIKNIRPSYGPLGATRSDMKLLPGDYLFINYEIEGLKVDANNKTNFITLVEVFDDKSKPVFVKESPGSVVIPQLGGNSMPGDLHVIMGTDRPPGLYKVRLTVKDAIGKEEKSFVRPFELLSKGFGVVGVLAPAVAFPGHPYMVQFNICELGLDAAKKPNSKLEIKILDETGKAMSAPTIANYPADLPDSIDLKKANFIPIDFPIFPNRAGRFTVEIVASDAVAQKTAAVRYPLNVLDLGALSGK